MSSSFQICKWTIFLIKSTLFKANSKTKSEWNMNGFWLFMLQFHFQRFFLVKYCSLSPPLTLWLYSSHRISIAKSDYNCIRMPYIFTVMNVSLRLELCKLEQNSTATATTKMFRIIMKCETQINTLHSRPLSLSFSLAHLHCLRSICVTSFNRIELTHKMA